MRVWLNNQPLSLVPGMTVRQALIQADHLGEVEQGVCLVVDEWENEVGLEGALKEGSRLYLKSSLNRGVRRR
jgi:hypothetical protein